ncbi:MAG: hypothetical protein V2A79_00235, partial [Planctomycetota bacterium]
QTAHKVLVFACHPWGAPVKMAENPSDYRENMHVSCHQEQRHLGNAGWVVRYRQRVDGRRRHRCIYVGEEILGEAARSLIGQWRAEAENPRERQVREWLRLTDSAASCLGYSKRARQRLKVAGEIALKDPHQALRFVCGGYLDRRIRDGRPRGRPAKSALW